jgi:hypothetical protein
MRALLAVVMAVVAAGSGYFVFLAYSRDRVSPVEARTARAHASTQALAPHTGPRNDSAELAALRRQVAGLGVQVANLSAQASQTRTAPAAPLDPTDPETEARLHEERRDYIEGVEAKFSNEPRDATWSPATHHAINEALHANELGDAVGSIECRSHICRVEIAEKGPDTNGMILRAVRQLGPTLPTVEWDHVDHGNGRRSKVLYMSRNAAVAR